MFGHLLPKRNFWNFLFCFVFIKGKQPVALTFFDILVKFIGLITGIIYFQTSIDQDGVYNLYGACFFLCTTATFANIGAVSFVSIIIILSKRYKVIKEFLSLLFLLTL